MKSSAKSLPHSGPVCFEAGGERPNYAPPGLLSEMRKNLRIAEERYRRTFEKAPIGIAETDIDGCILDANEQYCAIVGRARGELLGLHFSQVVHPEQLESTMADFEELIARRQTAVRHHRRYVRPDGKTGWGIVTLSALQDDAGNVDSVIVLVEDVTDRELAAGNLREHEEQLAEAQQIANMGSWEVDLATGRRTWSAQMCRMYGCPPGVTPDLELIRTLLHPDDLERVLAVERKARETLQPFSMAFRIVLLDGRTHITHVHGRFVFDLDGKPTKLVGVVQDITERVTHEDELRRVAVQQAAVANLGQLALSGASLDFLFHQVSAVVTNLLDVTDCEIVPKSSATPAAGGIIVEIPSSSDEAWGVLSIRCAIEQGSRTTDLDFLRSIAGILGQAIERQRADDELRLRAMQQSAIADLGKLMLSTVDDATLDRACDLVVQGLGVDYSCFAEITPDNTAMFHRGGRTWSDDLPQKMPVVEETHVGLTLLRGEPVIVDDYATETRFRTSALAVRSGIVSGLAVPVASATRSYGVLSAHTKTKRSFSPGDVDYLRSLANILADALEREAARAALVASVAEARREGSERQQVTRSLQLILESTIEGIYTMDVQGRCTMINAAAARMLGRSREEMLGQDMHELMHAQGSGGVPFEEVDCPIYRVLRDRAPRTVINDVFWRSDGSPLPIDYSAAPIFDGQTAVGAVVAFTDTTERRKLELKLEQANRLSSLGRLAATVAHEFNNVLMG
ncbi:MAG: sensor hybrid histidine kinase, partial [Acidobacteria bacterium]|nr:sensor hybrid histidine kinase [Acidobacteriota bacterium]